jgi:hypothetical protein
MKISIIRIIQYFALKFIPCRHCIWKITKQNPRVLCPKSSTPTVNVPLQPQIETRTQIFICITNLCLIIMIGKIPPWDLTLNN